MGRNTIISKLQSKKLRITPQRVAILEAILKLNNHPTADNIIEQIKTTQPNISIGTVYKVLDSFVENDLIKKVKTENGIMRYDPYLKHHHHLYCDKSSSIVDFEDKELDKLLNAYFKRKQIKNFNIQDINLQIIGKFI